MRAAAPERPGAERAVAPAGAGRGRAGAGGGGAAGGAGAGEDMATAIAAGGGAGFGLGVATTGRATCLGAGGGGAWTTARGAGRETDRPSGPAIVNGELSRRGTVTSVPSARTRTTPLAMDTSFALM